MLLWRLPNPVAVLYQPSVLELRAYTPRAVLREPVVFTGRAPIPRAVLVTPAPPPKPTVMPWTISPALKALAPPMVWPVLRSTKVWVVDPVPPLSMLRGVPDQLPLLMALRVARLPRPLTLAAGTVPVAMVPRVVMEVWPA